VINMNKQGSVCVTSPMKDKKQIDDMKEYLMMHYGERDYLLFVMGINTGLRISDLLKLTAEDVKTDRVAIREHKTGKSRQFIICKTCREAIDTYLKNSGITRGTLFPGKKDKNKPITSQTAWRILSEAAKTIGFAENFGTHGLKKTFGYWALKKGVNIAYIMQIFNHSSIAVTQRYLGITQGELDAAYINMNL